MLVEGDGIRGTIGGGHLEAVAIDEAHALLDLSSVAARVSKLVLGEHLAQCCGGVVELWMERYTRSDLPQLKQIVRAMKTGRAVLSSTLTEQGVMRSIATKPVNARSKTAWLTRNDAGVRLHEPLGEVRPMLYLYGAGHVGQSLIRLMGGLAWRVTWIDSRAELLPCEVPENVAVIHGDPIPTVCDAPRGAHVVVVTHDHALDYELCATFLRSGEHSWLGVIGSESKAARFRLRLAREGFTTAQIATLNCPIGLKHINDKSPQGIAVSIAAQLLQINSTLEHENERDTVIEEAAPCSSGEDCSICGKHLTFK
jgi:xanthine dehydrogenase accessory factor